MGLRAATSPIVRPRKFSEVHGDVILVTPPAEVTDEAVADLLQELADHLQRPRPYALVFDMSFAGNPSAKQRGMLSAHISENAVRVRKLVRGMALVAPSAVQRGVITAVFWLAPPPVEHRVFQDRDSAMRWAKGLA